MDTFTDGVDDYALMENHLMSFSEKMISPHFNLIRNLIFTKCSFDPTEKHDLEVRTKAF